MKLILLIILHLLLSGIVRYIAWPENLLWPYLYNHGFKLYDNIFYIYTPLYFYSLIFLPILLHSYLIIIVTDILLFLAGKRKFLPLLLFIPLQIYFEGNGSWPDQMLVPLFLTAYLLFNRQRYFLTGIVLATALLTKQTALYFTLLFLRPRVILGLFFVMLPFLIFQNQNFYDQTINYIFSHHFANTSQTLLPTVSQFIVVAVVFLPAIVGKDSRLILLMLAASLGVFTRFGYFHLQPALPFTALLLSKKPKFMLLFLPVFFLFLKNNLGASPKFLEPKFYQAAREINKYIKPGEKTLILNYWDHYYYLTNTVPIGNFFISSTPWNLTYPGIEEKILSFLRRETPEYIVYSDCALAQNTCFKPLKIDEHIRNNYQKILELPDRAGIFKYDPVGLPQKLQSPEAQN